MHTGGGDGGGGGGGGGGSVVKESMDFFMKSLPENFQMITIMENAEVRRWDSLDDGDVRYFY